MFMIFRVRDENAKVQTLLLKVSFRDSSTNQLLTCFYVRFQHEFCVRRITS